MAKNLNALEHIVCRDELGFGFEILPHTSINPLSALSPNSNLLMPSMFIFGFEFKKYASYSLNTVM